MIAGITRVRNESLIIADTIEHFLCWCDFIWLYDDYSDDDTAEIAERVGGDRITVIRGDRWRLNRVVEETRHRGLLMNEARAHGADWCLCFDADERLIGDMPDMRADGYRFRLFDGYLTERCRVEYASDELQYLPRMWGPEYRDILMLFKIDRAKYVGLDRREPMFNGRIEQSNMFVKHFGKCLSVDHWEQTCDYYAKYFPARYQKKWENRKGKAIHTTSDFGRELFAWDDLMTNINAWVKI